MSDKIWDDNCNYIQTLVRRESTGRASTKEGSVEIQTNLKFDGDLNDYAHNAKIVSFPSSQDCERRQDTLAFLTSYVSCHLHIICFIPLEELFPQAGSGDIELGGPLPMSGLISSPLHRSLHVNAAILDYQVLCDPYNAPVRVAVHLRRPRDQHFAYQVVIHIYIIHLCLLYSPHAMPWHAYFAFEILSHSYL